MMFNSYRTSFYVVTLVFSEDECDDDILDR